LVLTFLVGPGGLLLYLVIRFVRGSKAAETAVGETT
jgi:hypothetical protein